MNGNDDLASKNSSLSLRSRQLITVYSGWLRKLGGKFKTWKKRYFVLYGTDLSYYTSPEDTRPIGRFSLISTTIEIQNGETEVNGDGKGYIFTIKPAVPERYMKNAQPEFYLAASSPEERKAWICALRKPLYLEQGGALFGSRLEEAFTYAKAECRFLPRVIYETAEFIRKFGMDEEGIFRKCGPQRTVQELADLYDTASSGPILIPGTHSVHVAAGLLKKYLHELPEPLVPYRFYDRLKSAGFIIESGQDFQPVTAVLETLPPPNYNLMQFICKLLYEVSQHESNNRMSIANLARMFAPSFLRELGADLDNQLSVSSTLAFTVTAFIRYHDRLFKMELITPGRGRKVSRISSFSHSSSGRFDQRRLPLQRQSSLSENHITEHSPTIHMVPDRAVVQATPQWGPEWISITPHLKTSVAQKQLSNGGPHSSSSVLEEKEFHNSGPVLNTERSLTPVNQIPNEIQQNQVTETSICYANSQPAHSVDEQDGSVHSSMAQCAPNIVMRNKELSAASEDGFSLPTYEDEKITVRYSSTFPKPQRPRVVSARSVEYVRRRSGNTSFPDRSLMNSRKTYNSLSFRGRPHLIQGKTMDLADYQVAAAPSGVYEESNDYEPLPKVHENPYHVQQDQSDHRKDPHSARITDTLCDPAMADAVGMEYFKMESQIRYWRALAIKAQADAAGERARSQSLSTELNRIQCDLSVAKLEIGLLRQRLSAAETALKEQTWL